MKQTSILAVVMQSAVDFFAAAHLELSMFLAAVVGYYILFLSGRLQHRGKTELVLGVSEVEDATHEDASFDELDAALSAAHAAGHHAEACRLWDLVKLFEQRPALGICNIVLSMIGCEKDVHLVADELFCFFQKHPEECHMTTVNTLLEVLGRQLNSQLMALIADMLPSFHLALDERSYEILIAMNVKSSQYSEVLRLLDDMSSSEVRRTARVMFFALKAALYADDWKQSLEYFTELKASWHASGSTPPLLPKSMMRQLIELACQNRQLDQLLPELEDLDLSECAISSMLAECIHLEDAVMASSVEALARARPAALSDATYCLLLRASARQQWRVRAVLREVAAREGPEPTGELVLAVLEHCDPLQDDGTVDRLIAKVTLQSPDVCSAFVRFYLNAKRPGRACDTLELHAAAAQGRLEVGEDLERSVLDAALHCGRAHMVELLLERNRNQREVERRHERVQRCTSWVNHVIHDGMTAFAELNRAISHWAFLAV